MAKIKSNIGAAARRVRPADQKLGVIGSRLMYALTVTVSVLVISLVIIVIVVSNWAKTAILSGSVKIDNWAFDEGLKDKQSVLYIETSAKFCSAVYDVYVKASMCPSYKGCRVLGFREGSVVVDFELAINSRLVEQEKDILTMSELLILALLKKPGASTAFADLSVDEYKIKLPGIEKYIKATVKLPTATDICTAWQQKLAAKTMTAAEKECEAGWIQYKSSCYLIYTARQAYIQYAENYCTARQSHLVFIESEDEEIFLENKIETLGFTLKFFWTGAIRDPVTTRFKWVDYGAEEGQESVTPMCYRKWQVGQPDNYGGIQDHVALINHAWDDVRGYPKLFYFICEKDLSVDEKPWPSPDWSEGVPPPDNLLIKDYWPTKVTLTWGDSLWAAGRKEGIYMLVYYENLRDPMDRGYISTGEASVTVATLTPSSLYKMAVRVIRYKPGGKSSPWFTIPVIGTAVSELGAAPHNLQISYSGSLLLSWTIPEAMKQNIKAYNVIYWEDLHGPPSILQSDLPLVNITGLTPGKRYYFQVKAQTNSTYAASPLVVYRIQNEWENRGSVRLTMLCGVFDKVPTNSSVPPSPIPNNVTQPSQVSNVTQFIESQRGINETQNRLNETQNGFNETGINKTHNSFNETLNGFNSTSQDSKTTDNRTVSEKTPDLKNITSEIKGNTTLNSSIPLPIDCEFSTCRMVTSIQPQDSESVDVLCDRGWTVIQQIGPRDNAFKNRTWSDYKYGFGSPAQEHWIGNDVIHNLTNQMRYKLQIEIEDGNMTTYSATYSSFFIQNEEDFYRLHVDGFTGGMEDSFQVMKDNRYENGRLFSAQANHTVLKCPDVTEAGWWFNDCSNFLNGRISGENRINWGGIYNISKVVMKIKRNNE